MKQMIINAVDTFAAKWWHAWTVLADKVRPLGYGIACRVRDILDGDRSPCAACEEPGGTHIDCDFQAAGRMTKTERAQAFGATETVLPGRVTWWGYGKRWYGTATGKIHDEGLGAYAVVDPDDDTWGSRLVLLSHVYPANDQPEPDGVAQ